MEASIHVIQTETAEERRQGETSCYKNYISSPKQSRFSTVLMIKYSLNKVSQHRYLEDFAVPLNSPAIFFDLIGVETNKSYIYINNMSVAD